MRTFRSSDSPPEGTLGSKRLKMDANPGSNPSDEDAAKRERELRAAAAERRFGKPAQTSECSSSSIPPTGPSIPTSETSILTTETISADESTPKGVVAPELERLDLATAERLFKMVFGDDATPQVLSQWCQQGFRFGSSERTAPVLVQRHGGPCGVLAPVQALTLKHLLFSKEALLLKDKLAHRPEAYEKAWVDALLEAIWGCGKERGEALVVCAMPAETEGDTACDDLQQAMRMSMEDGTISSGASLHQQVGVRRAKNAGEVRAALLECIPGLQSGLGALLVLFSMLLSRGLDGVQEDRDDPEGPLVTEPFGHASQEIVNLFLCHKAVANVFDGNIDLGEGMQLKGIPTPVQVGFLTLMESLHLLQVGDRLKRPSWPVWVVGSESHYSVLFATEAAVQEDPEDEEATEERTRRVFDRRDTSGGGGFISPEALAPLLEELKLTLPAEKVTELGSSGIVVWQDLWQALKTANQIVVDTTKVRQTREFELVHFNGIEKASKVPGETTREPQVTHVAVAVPPKWTPADMQAPAEQNGHNEEEALSMSMYMEAPLVDCVRTRWQRARCRWTGESPSLV
mmetsp:Transcript_29891/g.50224  ORF Transcript_29891/g.50224 Transcript_29891/m.50224 type:complete len:574 (-) Transcript_29891:113-1834(-)